MSYAKRLLIPIDGDSIPLFTKTMFPISNGYTRVVIGGRGPYVEFDGSQIFLDGFIVPEGEEWRAESLAAYYSEYRTTDSSYTMLYHQKNIVAYADYRIGFFYISLFDLLLEDGSELLSDKFVVKENKDQMKLF